MLCRDYITRSTTLHKLFLKHVQDNKLYFDFNSIENGIMLQKRRRDGTEIVGDHANHPNYDDKIEVCIRAILRNWRDNPSKKIIEIKDLVNRVNTQIQNQVVNGTNIVNDMDVKCK